MSLIHATGLKRHYGAHEVLNGVDLRIERGDKIGCVGRNGGGKSTLLRIITSEEQPDSGEVVIPKGVRMGYVPQRPSFPAGTRAFEHVESGLAEARALQEEMGELEVKLGEVDGDELDRVVTRYGELSEQMEFLDGWNAEQRVSQVMSGIGLSEDLWEREAESLSGGEKSRVAMARELVRRPDLLLLDEPTNHLDLEGIEWLEEYLREFSGAVYLISHDRRMLENVVTAIVDLERGKLRRYPGNYSKYIMQREERFASELRAYEIQADQIRKESAFIKKHMGSQRTAEAKGRQKKLSRVERLERPYNDVRKPTLKLGKVQRSGEQVLTAEDLSIGFAEKVLHKGLEFRLNRGDRVGLVGPNGAGKTTLLKALAGTTKPLSGKLELGHKAFCGYYDQEGSDLDPESTPFMTIRRAFPTMEDGQIRGHLALFLFRGDDVDLPVGGLSGGERARLALARLVLGNPTWLALDEPTNHLDLAARTSLEEMLSGFSGAMICISHDRAFLDDLCNKIVELSHTGLREFRGNYSEYRAKLVSEREALEGAAAAKQKKSQQAQRKAQESAKQKASKPAKPPKQDQPKKQAKGGSSQKVRNPYRFKKLEEEIVKLETEREELIAGMSDEAVYRDGELLRERQVRLAEVERDLGERNAEWESWNQG